MSNVLFKAIRFNTSNNSRDRAYYKGVTTSGNSVYSYFDYITRDDACLKADVDQETLNELIEQYNTAVTELEYSWTEQGKDRKSGNGSEEEFQKELMKSLSYSQFEGSLNTINKTGHSGVYGKGGSLDKEQYKALTKRMKDIDDKQIIWDNVISFSPDFVEEQGMVTPDILQKSIDKNINSFFKANNLKPNNMDYYFSFHVNTNNPHIHLVFFEKDAKTKVKGKWGYKQRGLIDENSMKQFSYQIEKSLVLDKTKVKEMYETRDTLEEGFSKALEDFEMWIVSENKSELENTIESQINKIKKLETKHLEQITIPKEYEEFVKIKDKLKIDKFDLMSDKEKHKKHQELSAKANKVEERFKYLVSVETQKLNFLEKSRDTSKDWKTQKNVYSQIKEERDELTKKIQSAQRSLPKRKNLFYNSKELSEEDRSLIDSISMKIIRNNPELNEQYITYEKQANEYQNKLTTLALQYDIDFYKQNNLHDKEDPYLKFNEYSLKYMGEDKLLKDFNSKEYELQKKNSFGKNQTPEQREKYYDDLEKIRSEYNNKHSEFINEWESKYATDDWKQLSDKEKHKQILEKEKDFVEQQKFKSKADLTVLPGYLSISNMEEKEKEIYIKNVCNSDLRVEDITDLNSHLHLQKNINKKDPTLSPINTFKRELSSAIESRTNMTDSKKELGLKSFQFANDQINGKDGLMSRIGNDVIKGLQNTKLTSKPKTPPTKKQVGKQIANALRMNSAKTFAESNQIMNKKFQAIEKEMNINNKVLNNEMTLEQAEMIKAKELEKQR